MDLTKVKNIIFDLGGVILNIDYNKSVQELQKYGPAGSNIAYSQKAQSGIFDLFETGKCSSEVFRKHLRDEYQLQATDKEIDAAWNAMLLDIPQERIDLLLALGKQYRIFLMSNTNAIHLERFNAMVAHSFTIPSLDSLFEQTYYSHLIGKRKPDALVFEEILAENGLQKGETLFIDDSIQHIESARQVGLLTLHLQPPLTITEIFRDAVN